MDQGPRYVLRNRSQVVKGALLIFFGVALIAVTAFDPVDASFVPPGLAALGLVGIACAVFIFPRVVVEPGGLETRNWMFRVRVPWSRYRELDTRFGMYVVSSGRAVSDHPASDRRPVGAVLKRKHGSLDRKDVVASYPGAGGLSKGREQLGPSHRFGKSTPKSPGLSRHSAGTKKHWADMNQAIGLIEDVYTNTYLKNKRSKNYRPAPGTRAYDARAHEWRADEAHNSGDGVDGAFPTQRTKTLDFGSACCFVIGIVLLLAGISLSIS